MNCTRIHCRILLLILFGFQLDCSGFDSLINKLSLLLLAEGCFISRGIRSQKVLEELSFAFIFVCFRLSRFFDWTSLYVDVAWRMNLFEFIGFDCYNVFFVFCLNHHLVLLYKFIVFKNFLLPGHMELKNYLIIEILYYYQILSFLYLRSNYFKSSSYHL